MFFNVLLQRKIDILKMDIERMEWSTIPELLTGGALADVHQLAIEFHIGRVKVEVGKEKYLEHLSVFQQLYDAGYRIFQSKMNINQLVTSKIARPFVPCQEMFFIREFT